MFWFSKIPFGKSLVITFKCITNLYTNYPTLIVYSQKLQSKWARIEFVLTFYLPLSSPSPPKRKQLKKLQKLNGKIFYLGSFFPRGIFFSGDFFLIHFSRKKKSLKHPDSICDKIFIQKFLCLFLSTVDKNV